MAEDRKETRMSDRIENETVQVAAVAAAMLENFQFGRAYSRALADPGFGLHDQQGAIISRQIRDERDRQDYKWGIQNHTATEWAMILLEEVGELAEAVLEEHFPLDREVWEAEDAFACSILLDMVDKVEKRARIWCESHEWPEAQQKVYDAAKT
jgi:NTP pyrophosphatase (non-canonical NTP hydrolase)